MQRSLGELLGGRELLSEWSDCCLGDLCGACGEAGVLKAVAPICADAEALGVGKHVLKQLAHVLQGREQGRREGGAAAAAAGW